ncbi:MAG TPA: hypothetical protein VMF59_12920 [Bacteroidota bacterium]|nr:hypothetical protein [Bacteroidota bacterium]
MMKTVLAVAFAIICAGCGNNLAGPAGTPVLRPPSALTALSLDSTHVLVGWTAPADAADTTFRGYIFSWGTTVDTLPRTAVQFTAGPLAPGAVTFSIRSLLRSGQLSDAAQITWAPAWRFDASAVIVTEYNSALQTGLPGLDAGTATTNPHAVGFADVNADSTLDFYLYGPGGSSLQLVSASIYNPGWHQTLFSTVSTPSADLNAPLAAFPGDNTFTQTTVTLSDNTIYYVKTTGNAGEIYYVRIHVRLLGGSYPSRSADIRISLQRVSRLPYA